MAACYRNHRLGIGAANRCVACNPHRSGGTLLEVSSRSRVREGMGVCGPTVDLSAQSTQAQAIAEVGSLRFGRDDRPRFLEIAYSVGPVRASRGTLASPCGSVLPMSVVDPPRPKHRACTRQAGASHRLVLIGETPMPHIASAPLDDLQTVLVRQNRKRRVRLELIPESRRCDVVLQRQIPST